jgi:hypothetical protein
LKPEKMLAEKTAVRNLILLLLQSKYLNLYTKAARKYGRLFFETAFAVAMFTFRNVLLPSAIALQKNVMLDLHLPMLCLLSAMFDFHRPLLCRKT